MDWDIDHKTRGKADADLDGALWTRKRDGGGNPLVLEAGGKIVTRENEEGIALVAGDDRATSDEDIREENGPEWFGGDDKRRKDRMRPVAIEDFVRLLGFCGTPTNHVIFDLALSNYAEDVVAATGVEDWNRDMTIAGKNQINAVHRNSVRLRTACWLPQATAGSGAVQSRIHAHKENRL
jgi:hypothetical protein